MSETTPWFRVGHVTHARERTGCTVILFDRLVPAAVDVRGGAPGTRETALLDDGMLVGQVDAVLLTGGSAFGLAAADGVMTFLREQGRGLPTSAGAVPIVPAAVIYDLSNGEPRHPTAGDGYAAAAGAAGGQVQSGAVGAGTGAIVAKLGGPPTTAAGLGYAAVSTPAGTVHALVVLNAVGDVIDPEHGAWLARTVDPQGRGRTGRQIAMEGGGAARAGENTTIGAIMVDAEVDRKTLHRCCVSAHAALARCVVPSHTLFDGDTMFAVGRQAGSVDPRSILALSTATEQAVERAIVGIFSNR